MEVFTIFINGDDGFACLNYEGLKEILDDDFEAQEWVSVSRKHNENYRVDGNDGTRLKKLARNVYPGVIIEYFNKELMI